MNWFAAAILLLLAVLAFGLSLPAYAMYSLLGILLVSRWLARSVDSRTFRPNGSAIATRSTWATPWPW